jgi:hypothetical protein
VRGGQGEAESPRDWQVAWGECQRLLQSTDPKVGERGLALSGEVAGQVVRAVAAGGGLGVEAAKVMLGEWVARVEEGADEKKHVEEREAAVAAVCRSPLFLPPPRPPSTGVILPAHGAAAVMP